MRERESVCVYYICGTQMTNLHEQETPCPEYPGLRPEYPGRVLQSGCWAAEATQARLQAKSLVFLFQKFFF